MELDPTSLRLLGCLIEKEMTTPDYYPMTINALRSAASQKSNRDPVVEYSEQEIMNGLNGLREAGTVRAVRSPGGRAVKYKHALDDVLEIDSEQAALLAVLLLRGEQTASELRVRTERYHDFDDLTAVEEVLEGMQRRDEPLAERLERRPGEKEARYRHVMGSRVAPNIRQLADNEHELTAASVAPDALSELRQRLDELERRVEALENNNQVEQIHQVGDPGSRPSVTGPSVEPSTPQVKGKEFGITR